MLDKCELLIVEDARRQAIANIRAAEEPSAEVVIEGPDGPVTLIDPYRPAEFRRVRQQMIDELEAAAPEKLAATNAFVHASLMMWRHRERKA